MNAVAAALEYKNSASVANRIRALKKKFDLQVTCTMGSTNQSGSPNTTPTSTPRKGAKAARGPIKAKPEADSANASESKPDQPKQKKTPGRKRKAKVEENATPKVEPPVEDTKDTAPSTPNPNGKAASRDASEPIGDSE